MLAQFSMSRRPRLFGPGLLYHVIARGNQRQQTFFEEADYGAYLRRLALYRERHGVSLLAYCLMPNHVHLLVRTGDTPLSKFMQGVQQSYTLRFNRVYKKSGTFSRAATTRSSATPSRIYSPWSAIST